MPRDSQRSKVYQSDHRLRAAEHDLPSLDAVKDWVAKITSQQWFIKRWPSHRSRKIGGCWIPFWSIIRGRAGCRATGNYHQLSLPTWAWNKTVVLHEMAHGLPPTRRGKARGETACHGRAFCRTFLELLRGALGPAAEAEMKAAFRAYGVKWVCVTKVHRPTLEQAAAGAEVLRRMRRAAANPA